MSWVALFGGCVFGLGADLLCSRLTQRERFGLCLMIMGMVIAIASEVI